MNMSLAKRVEKLEGQQMPRPTLIGMRNLEGTVWADVPGIGRETFSDTEHFKERSASLGMDHFCVVFVDPLHPAVEPLRA